MRSAALVVLVTVVALGVIVAASPEWRKVIGNLINPPPPRTVQDSFNVSGARVSREEYFQAQVDYQAYGKAGLQSLYAQHHIDSSAAVSFSYSGREGGSTPPAGLKPSAQPIATAPSVPPAPNGSTGGRVVSSEEAAKMVEGMRAGKAPSLPSAPITQPMPAAPVANLGGRLDPSRQVRVGLKEQLAKEPDLGPTITLKIPPKPTNGVAAFFYKHSIGEIVRLTKEPKQRDQVAIDMLAKWCRAKATESKQFVDGCLMWKSVPWRQPIADYYYERAESRIYHDSPYFKMTGRRFLENNVEIQKSGCSAYVRFESLFRCVLETAGYDPKDPRAQQAALPYIEQAAMLLPEVLADPDLRADVVSDIADNLEQAYGLIYPENSTPYVAKAINILRAKRPELMHVYDGEKQVDLAWKARGNGYANTVTEEGWKGFKSGIANARKELTEAWRLDPSRKIAQEMLPVCLAEGNYDEEMQWFKRGQQYAEDDTDLRAHLMNMMTPQWGGSDEKLLAFGREAVAEYKRDGGDFYEKVYVLQIAHYQIGRGNPQAQLRRPEVYAELKDACEAVIKRNPDALDMWSHLAYVADIAGDFKTVLLAKAAMDKRGFYPTNPFSDRNAQREVFDRAEAMARR